MTSLYPAFQAAAGRYADRVAVRDEDKVLSWAALERESRIAALALLALGLERGDRFSIWGVNQWRWIVAGLSGQAVGATLVPASTRLKAGEVGDLLRRAKVRVLFCDAGFGSYDFVAGILAEDLPDLTQIVVLGDVTRGGRVIGWRVFMAGAAMSEADLDRRITAVDPNSLADVIFTSGTTGRPKGVPMTHAQSLIACEQQQVCVSHFMPGDVFAVTYPFAHNAGYRAGWQAALLYGATILPVRRYDPLDFLTLIDRERVTVLPAVPTIFQGILDHPARTRYDLSSLRLAATGATMIPVTLIERMVEAFGAEAVTAGYGLTEAAGSVTNTRPGDPPAVIATTTGKPLANLEVRLLDPEGRIVPEGQPGEIAVRGPQVLDDYYEDEDEAATTAAFTADGFFRTGDVGVLDADGNLKITDRLKDMYIVGGFNVYPAEVEHQLRRIDGVSDAAVIGVDDARLGQVGLAFVIRRTDAVVDAESVIAWCRAAMANYKVPRRVLFLDTLPLNPTGKVSKMELRKMAEALEPA